MPVNGLVTMTPSSVTKTGTGSTATINTNGSVTFDSCTALILNGVFTSDYDNYMIAMRLVGGSSSIFYTRFAASGTENSTSGSYVTQLLTASSSTVSGSRSAASSEGWVGYTDTAVRSGLVVYVFGPQLSQPTAWAARMANGLSSGTIRDTSGTHNQASSYDGIKFFPFAGSGNTFTGLVTVYGFNQ